MTCRNSVLQGSEEICLQSCTGTPRLWFELMLDDDHQGTHFVYIILNRRPVLQVYFTPESTNVFFTGKASQNGICEDQDSSGISWHLI